MPIGALITLLATLAPQAVKLLDLVESWFEKTPEDERKAALAKVRSAFDACLKNPGDTSSLEDLFK